MTSRRPPTIAAVREIMSAQRAALRKGDYAALNRLSDRLIPAIAGLDPARDGAALALLKEEAGHTARLVRAAQAGLARARADTGSARAAVLTTYDARGYRSGQPAGAGRTLARG